MKVLAIEGSGSWLACGAFRLENENNIIQLALQTASDGRQMSRLLLGHLDATLCEAHWTLDDVDCLGVGLGPGSWTSLRIVLSMVKTLAQSRALSLAGVSTFHALAASCVENAEYSESAAILTLAPSRAGEEYAQFFRVENKELQIAAPPFVGSATDIAHQMTSFLSTQQPLSIHHPLFLPRCEGNEKSVDAVTQSLTDLNISSRVLSVLPDEVTAHVARLAAEKIKRGEADNALGLLPIYVAPSAPERLKMERQKLEQENAR